MSAESITRLYERFSFQVTRACEEGRSAKLQDEFIQALAADVASTVYLRMDAELGRVTPDGASQLWTWLQEFPHRCGLDFIECVSTTLSTFHASAELIKHAEIIAASAYQEQLDRLLEGVAPGGSA